MRMRRANPLVERTSRAEVPADTKPRVMFGPQALLLHPNGKVKTMARFRVTFISRDNRARILIVEAPSRSEALMKAGPAREGESVTVEEDS